jgi:hypothetical protein
MCYSMTAGFPIQKLQSRVLHLHVFDYDRFSRDDSIGEVFVPLCQVYSSIQNGWRCTASVCLSQYNIDRLVMCINVRIVWCVGLFLKLCPLSNAYIGWL